MRPLARLSVVMVVAVLAGSCSLLGNPVDGNAAHGQVVAKARCAACHGADGNSPDPSYPRLAGLKTDYLYRQLTAYRDGTRPSPVMAAIMPGLSDQDMRDVSTFFASQQRGRDAAGPPDLMAEGRQLFRLGSTDGRVPACAACHSPGADVLGRMGGSRMGMGRMSGMGMMMQRPRPLLFGQHAAYVVGQLHAFADGARPATVMGGVAGTMSAQQAQAVADYVAAHP